ncbi:hypothetical protein JOQ06_021783 [Pogonophryne albipinna]|uniref:Uncharacterized protein n=1 Tax=Pogonophryne albipinna TaxID=1090488 RepID=A0AAD6ACA2_9TELE|nr:hypothetical protein JOQ06_021783 [Pogonophryne albipinna]
MPPLTGSQSPSRGTYRAPSSMAGPLVAPGPKAGDEPYLGYPNMARLSEVEKHVVFSLPISEDHSSLRHWGI